MKILIIQLSAIGDIIYTLFNIKALFQCNPDLIIDWLCAKPNALLAVQPEIRQVLTLNKDTIPNDYDYILDFGSKSSTIKFKLTPNAIKIGFWSKSLKKSVVAFFNDFSVSYDHSISVIENQRKLLASFLRFNLEERPVLTVPDDIKKQVDLYLASLPANKPLVILNPNASVEAKEYPLDYWTEAITKYPDDTLILIGEHFGKKGQQLAQMCPSSVYILPRVLDNLLAVGHLLSKSRLLISPDTSILHLAEFQGIPVEGLFTEKSNLQIKNWGTGCV
jgi:ADP-heptose:LPS heptosyltransferase